MGAGRVASPRRRGPPPASHRRSPPSHPHRHCSPRQSRHHASARLPQASCARWCARRVGAAPAMTRRAAEQRSRRVGRRGPLRTRAAGLARRPRCRRPAARASTRSGTST
eukprot:7253133-Prymnesium_polylepis.1